MCGLCVCVIKMDDLRAARDDLDSRVGRNCVCVDIVTAYIAFFFSVLFVGLGEKTRQKSYASAIGTARRSLKECTRYEEQLC